MTVTYCTAAQVGERLGFGWDEAETLDANAAETTLKIPIATGRKYTAGDALRVLNDDGDTEDATLSSIAYSATQITLTVGSMTGFATYTTAKNTTVQIKSYFTAETNPTKAVCEEIIEEAEAEINVYCRKSWGSTGHFAGYLRWDPRRVYSIGEPYAWYRILLPFTDPLTPLTLANGDSLKVWNGSTETEYVGVNTESRTSDFWFDQKRYLYLNKERPWPGENSVYLECDYGETTAPKDIRKACIYIAMGDFLDANRYNQNALTGNTEGESVPFQQSSTMYRNKAYTLLKKHRGIRSL